MRLVVATWNAPHRLRPHYDGLRWADKNGVDILVCQEHADKDNWAPPGWERHRPKRAQSNTIYFRKSSVRKIKGGAIRLSSPGFKSYRDLVWAHFKTRSGGHPIRVAGIHLPAFYSSRPPNRKEYDKQAPKIAKWMREGKNRVVGGDFNGIKGQPRLRPIEADIRLSTAVGSGPGNRAIDYVGVPKRNGAWKIVKTERGPKFKSDHRMILVTLERR